MLGGITKLILKLAEIAAMNRTGQRKPNGDIPDGEAWRDCAMNCTLRNVVYRTVKLFGIICS